MDPNNQKPPAARYAVVGKPRPGLQGPRREPTLREYAKAGVLTLGEGFMDLGKFVTLDVPDAAARGLRFVVSDEPITVRRIDKDLVRLATGAPTPATPEHVVIRNRVGAGWKKANLPTPVPLKDTDFYNTHIAPAIKTSYAAVDAQKPEAVRQNRDRFMQRVQEVENEGALVQVGAVVESIRQDPAQGVLMAARALPSIVGPVAAAKGIGTGAAQRASAAAIASGKSAQQAAVLSRAAAQKATRRYGTVAAAGTAGLQGGQQSADQFADTIDAMDDQQLIALSPEVAERVKARERMADIRRDIKSSGRDKVLLKSGAVTAATSVASGAARFEAQLGSRVGGAAAGNLLARAGLVARKSGEGVVKEATQEGVDAGYGRYAQNRAVKDIIPSQSLTQGVFSESALGATVGGAMGGGVGGAQGLRLATARAESPPAVPPKPAATELAAVAPDTPAAPSYSRAAPPPERETFTRAAQALQKLVGEDSGYFRLPVSQKKRLADIAGEVQPQIEINGERAPQDQAEIEAGVAGVYDVRMPDGAWGWVYRYSDGRVAVDASRFTPGYSRGSELTAIVGNWAYNNGYKLEGDRQGATHLGRIRGIEAMLNSALKHGTTRHLDPHPNLGLRWGGSEAENLGYLLESTYETVLENVPEIAAFRYNFEHGRFETTLSKAQLAAAGKTADQAPGKAAGLGAATPGRHAHAEGAGHRRDGAGQPHAGRRGLAVPGRAGQADPAGLRRPMGAGRWRHAGDDTLRDLAELGGARAAGIGSKTLKRAALARSLLQAAGRGSGNEVLAQDGEEPHHGRLRNTPLEEIGYSRTGPAQEQAPPQAGSSVSSPVELRKVLAKRLGEPLIAALEKSGKLRIVEHQSDLSGERAGIVRGLHEGGVTTLVAENLGPQDVTGVLLHEGGHAAQPRVDTLLGRNYDALVTRFQGMLHGQGKHDIELAREADHRARAEMELRRADGLSAADAELNAERVMHFIELVENAPRDRVMLRARQLHRDLVAAMRQWVLARPHLPPALRGVLARTMTGADFVRLARGSLQESKNLDQQWEGNSSGNQPTPHYSREKDESEPVVQGVDLGLPGGGLRAHEGVLSAFGQPAHTLTKHVGKSVDDLRNRLANTGLNTASTFRSEEEAEKFIGMALGLHRVDVRDFAARPISVAPNQNRMVLSVALGVDTGVVLSRGSTDPVSGAGVRLILDRVLNSQGLPYVIVTGFPIP